MADEPPSRGSLWLPFTDRELGVLWGVLGLVGTALTVVVASWQVVFAVTGALLVAAYFAALLVRAREQHRSFSLIVDGGLEGEGHVPLFREAKRSLLLMHVDDDVPNETLLGLYRDLLRKGVLIRRIVFLRPSRGNWEWLVRFGNHANLLQRAVLPEQAELMRFSFAVVDEQHVILSVPNYGAVDADAYGTRFLLRHLLVLHDPETARVFGRLHKDLWMQGHDLADVHDLLDLERFVASCRDADTTERLPPSPPPPPGVDG